jgi:nitrate/nitrite-specific signal transduction histidine kinase
LVKQSKRFFNLCLCNSNQCYYIRCRTNNNWNTIYQKWVSLKTVISDNIIKSNKQINSTPATLTADKDIRTTAETRASSLVDSSNLLVTDLGEYARISSQYSMFLQGFLAVLNIAVTLIVLYLVMRIIKPIFALTVATSKVTRGNLDVSVRSRGEDELSVLTDSFNSMVKSLKNYIKKQNELTKELENANEELKHQDQLLHMNYEHLSNPYSLKSFNG